MIKKYLLTLKGLEKIKDELRDLVEIQRPQIIKEIQEAREQGDLSENADYDAAKSHQTVVESRIQELQEILTHYELINETDLNQSKVVSIGSKVKFYDFSDKKSYEYEIVGSFDADPLKNKISNESPIAKTIIGLSLGDIVEVRGISRPYKIRIDEIN